MENAEKVLVTENRQYNKMYMQKVWILFIMQSIVYVTWVLINKIIPFVQCITL